MEDSSIDPSVISKVDGQKIGDVYFLSPEDVYGFISGDGDYRSQNIIFLLKNILEENKKEISLCLTHELGKPISQVEEEINSAIDLLDNYISSDPGTEKVDGNILVIGSVIQPIYELAYMVSKYIYTYKKLIYKASTKVPTTMNLIAKKMAEIPDVKTRLLICLMTKNSIDKVINKLYFDEIYNFSRAVISANTGKYTHTINKDRIMLVDESGDLEASTGQIIDNLFNYNKFHQSKIQHIFVQENIFEEFLSKLIIKLNFTSNFGDADKPEVNITDIYKSYKKSSVREFLLDIVSMGGDILYGGVEDTISSPTVIKCTNMYSNDQIKSFWLPLIFVFPFTKVVDIKPLVDHLSPDYDIISFLSQSNIDLLK